MEYLALFVIAMLGQRVSARSWRGHDDYYHHNHPSENQNNFNYNAWCHRPGGWNSNWGSWEDSSSSSGESQEWNDSKEKDRPIRSSTTTTKSVIMNNTPSILIRQSSTGNTPSVLEVMLCLRSCPITSEYNPVCGTDNNTYINPGRLQCAISCGIDVALKRPSSCPTVGQDTQPTSSTASPVSTTVSPQVVATCMRSCPVTSEYNPICGTDNITYQNPSRLKCAQGCGKAVTMMLPSRCPPADQITSTTTTISTTTTNATPATSSSTSTTPMAPTTSSMAPSSPNPGPNVTPANGSTSKFTIAQNILDGIFNGGSTTESVPDFSLDERYE